MNDLLKLIYANKGKIGVGTYRAVLLSGVIWLNQSFVGKKDYEKDQKAQSELNIKVTATLAQIQTTLTLMSTQDERLRDHETRLRALEKTPVRYVK